MNKELNIRAAGSYVAPRCEVYHLPELHENVMQLGGSDGTKETFSGEMNYDDDTDDWMHWDATWDN